MPLISPKALKKWKKELKKIKVNQSPLVNESKPLICDGEYTTVARVGRHEVPVDFPPKRRVLTSCRIALNPDGTIKNENSDSNEAQFKEQDTSLTLTMKPIRRQ